MLKLVINNNHQLEVDFFKHFNPVKKVGGLMKRALITKLKEEYESAQSEIESRVYRFLRIRLKNIITGSPIVLNEIVNHFDTTFPEDIFYDFDEKGKKVDSKIAKRIKEIFNYKTFRSSDFCINHLRELGFQDRTPCPYCNFDELSIVTRNIGNNDLALLDLDHFIPQSKYPFLSLSLYNLIPSCHNCNSRFKGETLFLIDTHINPFDKSFDEHFRFKLDTPFIYGMDINDFSFSYSIENGFPDNSIIDLNIIQRYDTAKKELLQKLNIIYKVTENKKDEFVSLFGDDGTKELMQLADFPVDSNEITSHKMGKIKRDIYLENWNN
ncbi:HNH endonuclease [Tenacibaculum sp. SDUM215027]|uniref:HNH endonuclease n=1 Tax=Tenacibaculum sp. SDUM215027 TaxID=3422596 RepID=UPI003D323725